MSRLARIVAPLLMLAGVLMLPASAVGAATPGVTPGVTLHPCTNPTSHTSSPSGHLGPYGHNVVSADVWNDQNIHQTVYGCSGKSWYATESASGTAVQAYPDTNWTLASATPISTLAALTEPFGCQVPESTTGFIGECADDIWVGGGTEWSGGSTEVMVWLWNHKQVPAGKVVATTTLSGITWQVWEGPSGPGNIVTYEATSNVTSGDLDLLSVLNDIQARGYFIKGSNVWQYGFGWEICQAPAGTVIGIDAFNVKGAS